MIRFNMIQIKIVARNKINLLELRLWILCDFAPFLMIGTWIFTHSIEKNPNFYLKLVNRSQNQPNNRDENEGYAGECEAVWEERAIT